MSEFSYIDWLRQKLKSDHAPTRALKLGPGDDMALIEAATGGILFAADMLLDGAHFNLHKEPAYLAGRKALAVNLSDVAAMAGTPMAVVISLALPKGNGRRLAEELARGIIDLASEYDVAVAGGDTNSWHGPLVINIAIIGKPHAGGCVTRQGARQGDMIFVTGPLGGSIFGRHLSFCPRLAEARTLHERYQLTAMIDISDGLASDLRHILTSSACSARLHQEKIPIHPDAHRHQDGRSALDHALCDGEDFELCFTLPAERGKALLSDCRAGRAPSVVHIGEITEEADPGHLVWSNGQPLTSYGFSHQV